MMDIERLVVVLRDLHTEEGVPLDARGGENALDIAEEMERFLESRFREDRAGITLWRQFQADPEANEVELMGTLEALVEADPAMEARLANLLEAYEAQIEPPAPGPEIPPTPEDVATGKPLPDVAPSDEYQDYDEDGTYVYGNVPRDRKS